MRYAKEHPTVELEAAMEGLYAAFLGGTNQDNLLLLRKASGQSDAMLQWFEAIGVALLQDIETATRQFCSERRLPQVTAEQRDLIDLKLSRLSTASHELATERRRRAQRAREATSELWVAILQALRGIGTVESGYGALAGSPIADDPDHTPALAGGGLVRRRVVCAEIVSHRSRVGRTGSIRVISGLVA